MELGYFSMPSHPPERGLKAGHDWDLQTLRWLDELGFTEAWIRTTFYANDLISQCVSGLMFLGLCAYLWFSAVRRKKENEV